MKILIADAMSGEAVDILKSKGLSVDVKTDLKKEELAAIIGEYDALIVRSATKVTRDIIANADKLKVIGRAGIGVDNVDVEAATEKGIVVMNTPQGNALAAAEHTVALMFAVARKVALADATMKQGKWEKKLLMGIEVYNKTLGVIGIGNIGMIVAEKAVALGMRVIAYDLFVTKEVAEAKGIELVGLDTLLAESDFITVHLPMVRETKNLIEKNALAKTKKGVVILNVARGGIVNEMDLYDALMSGHVSGAGLDVFEQEPPPKDHPLVLTDKVVCTPHLGASTKEAQEKVAIDIADQIVDFALNGVIRNSVNAPPVSIAALRQISPYLGLSERLATFVSSISEFPVENIEVEYMGDISEVETKILTQAIVRNILSQHVEGVNYVNAPIVARSRGIKIKEIREKEHEDYTSLLGIRLTNGKVEKVVYGTLLGKEAPRLVRLDGIAVVANLAGNMLLTYHQDRPGVVGSIGTALANKGINIGGMHVGRKADGGLAIAVLDVDVKVSDEVITELQGVPNVIEVKRIEV
ncbi:MAG TPA: phosphoglycerate dehydrogenase [Syntrophorhabdales bacterium]|nr:phosphoglycerate dehydrogenase [Syntrophorhabdales bacterium]